MIGGKIWYINLYSSIYDGGINVDFDMTVIGPEKPVYHMLNKHGKSWYCWYGIVGLF